MIREEQEKRKREGRYHNVVVFYASAGTDSIYGTLVMGSYARPSMVSARRLCLTCPPSRSS